MTKNKDSTRYYSHQQEQYVADLLGGKLSANSGAANYSAGDVLLMDWLIECKTTMKPKQSFSIKEEWMLKNKLERIALQKTYSALAFQFEPNGTNYFVVDERTFERLLRENGYA